MLFFLFLDLPIGCSEINTKETTNRNWSSNFTTQSTNRKTPKPKQRLRKTIGRGPHFALKFQKIIFPKKVLNHGSYPSYIHDKCYITPGMSQNSCDQLFLANMREKCKMPGAAIFAYPICVTVAKIAVEVVSSIDQGPELKIICYGTSMW